MAIKFVWPDAKGLAIILLISFFLFDSLIIEPNNLTITHNDFDLSGGTNGSGIRIAFISDLHIGQQRAGYLEEVVGKINALEPDIVLIGGDSIEGDETELEKLGPLGALKPPYGTYAVLGNHDYGTWGCPTSSELADKVERKLESMNITVLRNENKVLDINGKKLALIGLDDSWVCRNDYTNASRGLDDSMPKIVLAHNQLSVEPADIKGKSVILSGHTHCGKVRIPFITQLVMGPGFGSVLGGRERLDNDTEIYVTCGVTGDGMRFLSNPEISVINIE
jgi:predicted MPP superfamily phosphohydrolase